MGLRPTQGDEKRLLFSNYSAWKHRPPPCHLDRSAAQWRDLCVDDLSWKRLTFSRVCKTRYARLNPVSPVYQGRIASGICPRKNHG
jgi:hypothetical protein